MNKLYQAPLTIDICAVADPTSSSFKETLYTAIKDEMSTAPLKEQIYVLEIKRMEDVSKEWECAIYYGHNPNDWSVKEFFADKEAQKSKDYQEYLRLKASLKNENV